MRYVTLISATVVAALVMTGCGAAPKDDPVKPKPTATSSTPKPPATSKEFEPSPNPATAPKWSSTSFAFGMASVDAPDDAVFEVFNNDSAGEAPRWAGGYAHVTLASGASIALSTSSAALNGIGSGKSSCNERILERFSGAPKLASPNELALMLDQSSETHMVMVSLVRSSDTAHRCETLTQIPNVAGGVDTGIIYENISSDFSDSDARSWLEEPNIQEAVEVLRSFSTW